MTPRWTLAALLAAALCGCPDSAPDLPPSDPPTPELPPAPPPREVEAPADDGAAQAEGGAVGLMGQATDPVCGTSVELTGPAITAVHDDVSYRFCSDACRERFTAEPAKYLAERGE